MAWNIIALGTLKKGAEFDLCQQYITRLKTPLRIIELEEKRPLSEKELKEKEANLILNAIPNGAKVIALDERGKTFSSVEFSKKIQAFELDGYPNLYFIIGGAFGLSERVRNRADLTISFGQMTFPHMLARAMLCEQLYRTSQILDSHPYHKV